MAISFGKFLKNIMDEKNFSCRRLGALSDVDHSYISKICKGETAKSPSPDILKKLAGPLGIPYEELLRAAGYLNPADDQRYVPKDIKTRGSKENLKSGRMYEVMARAKALPEDDIEEVADILNVVISQRLKKLGHKRK